MSRSSPSVSAKGTGFYEDIQESVGHAAGLLKLDNALSAILAKPANEIEVHFPARMDDDRIEMFTGWRVQHNNVLGPFYGGLRYDPVLDMEKCRGLSTLMTASCALAPVPFGGAMGGIRMEPSRYTITELERITRRFTYALGSNIGPEYDIISPDLNTQEQIMAWIQDTFLSTVPPQERQRCLHVVVGKPLEAGGSQGAGIAAGESLALLVEAWAGEKGVPLAKARFFLQGFGSVGAQAAKALAALGATLVAVEDATGALANPSGIDPAELLTHAGRHGGVRGFPKAKAIGHEDFLGTKAEIFIPAAIEDQITAQSAALLNVRLVAEGAFHPVDHEADEILKGRGIEVLPDLLCNSGALIVRYFEWLQNKRAERLKREEVLSGMRKMILAAYSNVVSSSRKLKTDLRMAALAIALSSLEKVYVERGIFP
jgi:glutamate dehydrogenase (NAD(P)+)